jgi:hypothetical protein
MYTFNKEKSIVTYKVDSRIRNAFKYFYFEFVEGNILFTENNSFRGFYTIDLDDLVVNPLKFNEEVQSLLDSHCSNIIKYLQKIINDERTYTMSQFDKADIIKNNFEEEYKNILVLI